MVTKKVCVLGWSTFEIKFNHVLFNSVTNSGAIYTYAASVFVLQARPKQNTPYVMLKVMHTHWLCLACKPIHQCDCMN